MARIRAFAIFYSWCAYLLIAAPIQAASKSAVSKPTTTPSPSTSGSVTQSAAPTSSTTSISINNTLSTSAAPIPSPSESVNTTTSPGTPVIPTTPTTANGVVPEIFPQNQPAVVTYTNTQTISTPPSPSVTQSTTSDSCESGQDVEIYLSDGVQINVEKSLDAVRILVGLQPIPPQVESGVVYGNDYEQQQPSPLQQQQIPVMQLSQAEVADMMMEEPQYARHNVSLVQPPVREELSK